MPVSNGPTKPVEVPADVGKPALTGNGFRMEDVISTFETPLLRYVARLIGTRYDEAQDVVQNVFIQLHGQVATHGAGSISNLRCWLYRVAHNQAMDCGRQRQRDTALADSATHDPIARDRMVATPVATADAVLTERERGDEALAALGELPEEQREIILLKIIQGLTLREISEITGIKIGTVNYRLTQGLLALGALLKKEGTRP